MIAQLLILTLSHLLFVFLLRCIETINNIYVVVCICSQLQLLDNMVSVIWFSLTQLCICASARPVVQEGPKAWGLHRVIDLNAGAGEIRTKIN